MKKNKFSRHADYERHELNNFELYGGIKPDFSGQDLSWKNFVATSLGHANFRDANLTGTIFDGAILSGADLRGANLTKASFKCTALDGTLIDEKTQIDDKWFFIWQLVNSMVGTDDLSRRDLSYVRLRKMDLSHSDLSGADLTGSMLMKVNFENANLSGTVLKDLDDFTNELVLHDVIVDEKTVMDEREWLVWQIVNQGAVGRQLHEVDLSGTYLKKANFSRANLHGAHLRGSILEGANFSAADLRLGKLRVAKLHGANFDGADLRGTNFDGAQFQGANLENAQIDDTTYLIGARYDNETKWPEGLDLEARRLRLV